MRLSFILLFLLAFACTPPKIYDRSFSLPAGKDQLLNQPLPIPLQSDEFQNAYKRFKLKKFVRTPSAEPTRKDSIYRFYKKKTHFIFYQISGGEEYFLTGKIRDKLVVLRGGLYVGMSRNEMQKQLTDVDVSEGDTLHLANKKRQLVFIFDDSQLAEIQLNNYFNPPATSR
jgi:hypothetical protein